MDQRIYIITANRMISGEVLKYLKGDMLSSSTKNRDPTAKPSSLSDNTKVTYLTQQKSAYQVNRPDCHLTKLEQTDLLKSYWETANSCSIARIRSNASGLVREPHVPATLPSTPIRILLKFHLGTKPLWFLTSL